MIKCMKYKGVKYEMFGGQDSVMNNALYAAFSECAGGTERIYEWIEDTPKTSMIVELVDKLKEMGYKIVKA